MTFDSPMSMKNLSIILVSSSYTIVFWPSASLYEKEKFLIFSCFCQILSKYIQQENILEENFFIKSAKSFYFYNTG